MRIRTWIAAIGVLIAMSATDARAQMSMGSFRGYLTGHVGLVAAGEVSDPNGTLGVSVSVQEQTGWGAELDVGHASDARSGIQVLDLTTYFVSGAWIKPAGFVRPFFLAGAGVMQIDGCDSPCDRPATTYDFGLGLGGGAHVVVSDSIAVRGDARYFWSGASHPDLRRPESFSFWRISAGVTFMWAILP
jgi:opacity protein-like surface antigen